MFYSLPLLLLAAVVRVVLYRSFVILEDEVELLSERLANIIEVGGL